MTKEELNLRRGRARPIIIHAWQRRNPNVRIKPLIGINPNYYVTSDGRVYCLHTIRDEQGGVSFKLESVKTFHLHNAGTLAHSGGKYLHVHISISSNNAANFAHLNLKTARNRLRFTVHQLVARYFCSHEFFDRTEVDHLDGNPVNNNASNLEWVTPAENRRRAIAMRRAKKEQLKTHNS